MPKDTDSESDPGRGSGRELRGYLGEMAWAFLLINLIVGLVGWLVGRYLGEPRLGTMIFLGGSLIVTTVLGVIVLLNAGILALVRGIRRWTAGDTVNDGDGDDGAAPSPSDDRRGSSAPPGPHGNGAATPRARRPQDDVDESGTGTPDDSTSGLPAEDDAEAVSLAGPAS